MHHHHVVTAMRISISITCHILAVIILAGCGGGSSGSGDDTSNQALPGNTTTPPGNSSLNTPTPKTAGYNLGNTPQAVIDQCMSAADKEMLTRVNQARLSNQQCGATAHPATHTLNWHCTLETAARGHSQDMAQTNFFNHTGSDGLSAGDRIKNTGYSWSTWGENIAAGQTTVEQVMNSWMNSEGHCANIMNVNFTEMGAASFTDSGSDFQIYWTQNFAAPR